jgi:YfiH family protein
MTGTERDARGLVCFTGLPEGFRAGFTTRTLAPDEAGSAETARRLAVALGAPDAERMRLRQVHGRGVIVADDAASAGADVVAGEADALVTRTPGRIICVASADCVPMVLVDPETGWTAAVHAGWRGTAARIVDAVLDVLEGRGVRPERLQVFFGPSIARGRYEVGPEVVGTLREAYAGIDVDGEAVARGEGDHSYVDVAAFDRAALLARGVREDAIVESGLCTFERPELPSYRRDGAGTGRVITGIVRLS